MKFVFLLIFTIALVNGARGQNIRVDARVGCKETVCAQALSKINRFFRELKDVTVTSDDPNFVVMIYVMETMIDNRPAGFVMTSMVCEPLHKYEVEKLSANTGMERQLREYYSDYLIYKASWVSVIRPDGIEDECRAIVERVDADSFEKLRKYYQKRREDKARGR